MVILNVTPTKTCTLTYTLTHTHNHHLHTELFSNTQKQIFPILNTINTKCKDIIQLAVAKNVIIEEISFVIN